MKIQVYRNGTTNALLPVTQQSVFIHQLMGENKIILSFVSPAPVDVQIGDTIEYRGNSYTVNTVPDYVKHSSIKHSYNVIFEGAAYRLYDKKFMNNGDSEFTYFGNAQNYILQIIENINEIDSGWTIGNVDLTAEKHIPFSSESCRTALTKIADEFKLEWSIEGKQINLVQQIGIIQPLTFEYGKGKGLYSLQRNYVQDKNIVTKVYGYGSSRNLSYDYRGGKRRLTFGTSPLIHNDDLYKIKEGDYVNEEIYPHRDGTVTGVGSFDSTAFINKFSDASIDFDLNQYLLEGLTAKVVFKSGELSGHEFEITQYDHSTKTVSYKSVTEDNDYRIPNDTFQANIGDLYTFVDIKMPQVYIDVAETQLATETQQYIDENSVPQVLYSLDLDILYARDNNILISPGDKIMVKDDQIGINEVIRITGVNYPLLFPHVLQEGMKITATVSNFIAYTVQERLISDTTKSKKLIRQNIRDTSHARKVADEVAAAAILTQFKKVYIGENAILSGAFVVGNPDDGEVGSVSGVGEGLESVVFSAGSTFANRANAPFNVRRSGKGYATSFEFKDGCKIGNFEISNGYLRTSDFGSGVPSGVLISDDGIASRNTGATWIPATTGIGLWGSLFGMTSEEGTLDPSVNFSYSPTWSGMVGISLSQLTNQALENTAFSKGVYGALVSSIKNLGAVYEAARWSGTSAGNEVMTLNDHMLIVQGDKTNVILPDTPDHGMRVIIKNARDINITVSRASDNAIIGLNNAIANSQTVISGQVIQLIYFANGKRWLVISLS